MDAWIVRSNDAGEIIPPPLPRPPLPKAIVEDIQRNLGFPLPILVQRLYTEVADGGYGPSYGIIRLRSPEGTDPTRWWEQPMSVEAWSELYRRETEEDGPHHRPAYPPKPSASARKAATFPTGWTAQRSPPASSLTTPTSTEKTTNTNPPPKRWNSG